MYLIGLPKPPLQFYRTLTYSAHPNRRGVDIRAIEFIHRKILELRDAGSAVLLVSAELEEVMALADRLLVIRDGKIAGEVDSRSTSVEEIGLMMTGG